MTRLRTMIVDDEPLAVERLQILCNDQAAIEVVGTASDGVAALRVAQQLLPDLIFLDVGMPKMDGINAARALGLMERKPAVVLVTAYDNFAVEAFDLDIVDYVLKPVSGERLGRAVARAQAALDAPAPKADAESDGKHATEFWVSHRAELIRIAAVDIERIEAERDYMRLHTGQRSYLLHQTISALEQRLNPEQFQRIHRSHIVRRDLITGLRHEGGGVWHALLGDDMSMRIGRKYLADVKRLAGK
ncbi:MAG TPA: LytTR family DNA-binding domain-containing protein [Sphingorhabdus sp.]|jgi:two-component system response regulator AlgR|nr:LytTR family DNA-binding domain-containing protein [Sphingorhabdus sp.]